MDSIGTNRQRYVGSRVDQKSSSQFSVLSSQLIENAQGLASQRFELPGGEILFAKLDLVDAGAGGFDNFFQQAPATHGFVPRECIAVGDVVEKAAVSWSLVDGRERTTWSSWHVALRSRLRDLG